MSKVINTQLNDPSLEKNRPSQKYIIASLALR
jgi:hypothetical protein